MQIDPWILAFSALTVLATVWMGFWSARRSKTAHDFYVAGRSVSVGWNASAISGEYLSAASFMGVAGMVMSSGYDALWYPVCYACGYLFLLLFIAGPLRRFGAYTIPDFAEGRFDSPVFRKIAVVFVLFIGFFYTMPQMKGAGTTLAYIFPGLPYWAGVVLVGAVITLNVALGGMKGITLVQAFQYWAKMFAISVPIFVLMAVYGHYGKQIQANGNIEHRTSNAEHRTNSAGNLRIKPDVEFVLVFQGPTDLRKAVGTLEDQWHKRITKDRGTHVTSAFGQATNSVYRVLYSYAQDAWCTVLRAKDLPDAIIPVKTNAYRQGDFALAIESMLAAQQIILVHEANNTVKAVPAQLLEPSSQITRQPLPEKAPADSTWLSPFGPLTTKAAKAAKPSLNYKGEFVPSEMSVAHPSAVARVRDQFAKLQAMKGSDLGGQKTVNELLARYASASVFYDPLNVETNVVTLMSKKLWTLSMSIPTPAFQFNSRAEYLEKVHEILATNGVTVIREGRNIFKAYLTKDAVLKPIDTRPYALLYTYSLIIALVCGTAGLPHILVRFYTNPDGVAAKRTTMWVMILIGVFYLFPPVFGVMGRNLLPELYAATGAKGTDKVVLELPRILNEKGSAPASGAAVSSLADRTGTMDGASAATREGARAPRQIPWGSILSGITCAGAFAAFMSTFSGLLVSMTGALAHDVYGRMLNPKSTPQQRLRAFKICAVIIGAVAILLGMQVEPLQINFMVGQAFAIAAASYFPLLFMSAWWRGMTMKGAAAGMLAGGILALSGITLTSFSDLKWLKLEAFWAAHPLMRILCEQPAIWTVPLAILLMVIVSKLTRREVPSDIRIKMLVLHAPEKLGLKQEYIQEHHHGH